MYRTAAQWQARAEAWDECASHMEQVWTDNPLERHEGKHVARYARRQALDCSRRAERSPKI
jgi:hypothetical protein